MQSLVICLSLLYFGFCVPILDAWQPAIQEDAIAGRAISIELLKTDIFKITDWSSRQISVFGARLGTTRDEVSSVLKVNYGLFFETKPTACVETNCAIFTSDQTATAVYLKFNHDDILIAIRIEPWPPGTLVPPPTQLITNRLVGGTSELVNSYSDSIRKRYLGREDERWQEIHERPDVFTEIKDRYRYNRGLIIQVDSYQRAGQPLKGPRLEWIEFVAPEPERGK